jgi:glutathione S-transferase/CDGSH-type Zn-finger protein
MSEEAKRYLSQNDIPQIVENMTAMLIKDTPDKPVNAMAQFLMTQGGVDTDAYDLKTRAVVAKAVPIPVEVEAGKKYYWCTCGASKTQPFCDGSHVRLNKSRGTNFTPLLFEPMESKQVYFCQCRATKNPPMCDGSHKKLEVLQLTIFGISVNCAAVVCMARDANIPIEVIAITPQESKSEEFLKKFPMGQVPALSDGNFHTFESSSILRYLCHKFKLGAPWCASEPQERARVDRVLDWRQTAFYPALSGFCYPPLKFGTADEATLAGFKAKFTDLCALFTGKLLEGKPFIGGEKPSIADYSVACSLPLVAATDFTLSPEMQAYFDRFKAASLFLEESVAGTNAYIASLKS